MKKIISVIICFSLLLGLCGCVSYRKTDVFSFLDNFEKNEPYAQRQQDLYKKDDTYYVYYKTPEFDTYLLTVSTDEFEIPQTVRLFFSKKLFSSSNTAYITAKHCLSAFTQYEDAVCEEMLLQIGADKSDSYFSLYSNNMKDEKYNISICSVLLFTCFEFSLADSANTENQLSDR